MRWQFSSLSLVPGALFLMAFLFNFAVVVGTAVNRSIDDTLGDSVTGQRPIFLPSTSGVWEDETCCALQPPTSSAFGGTYTAATYNPGLRNMSITFDFTGTAIYIFFILANNPGPGITATTAANFTLDGSLAGTFNHSPNSSAPNFQFNRSALAFSKAGLKNMTHQMVISTSGLDEDVWVNFDYALYTFQNAAIVSSSESNSASTSANSSPSATVSASSNMGVTSSQSTSAIHLGVIVGGAVGGLALLTSSIAVLFVCHRRRRKRKRLERVNNHINDDPESGSQHSVVVQHNVDPLILPKPTLHHNASKSTFTVHKIESDCETTVASSSDSADSTANQQSHCTEIDDSIASPLEYQYRSVVTTLPSGQIIMTAGTNQDIITSSVSSSVNIPNYIPSDSSSALPMPVLRTDFTTSEKSELRRIRQEELERQMREINEEIEELKNEAAERSDPSSHHRLASRTSVQKKKSVRRGGDSDQRVDSVSQLKAQIREMSEQIALLQSQQNSAWAQGLSDEPPPGYSPRLLVANREQEQD